MENKMQTPKFLQELISSPEYSDKNSETYKRVTKYMNILYPGIWNNTKNMDMAQR